MNTDVLNTSYDHLSDPKLLAKAKTIHAALINPTNSATYAAVTPTPVDLLGAITDFESKLNGKNPQQVEAREAARQGLLNILVLMGVSLEGITPVDRVSLAGTGYDLHKIPERDHSPIGTPENVKVKPTGIAGEAKLDCKGVPKVLTYEYEWTHDPMAGPWTHVGSVSNKRNMLVTGLQRGKDTWFRIRAQGRNGAGPWSDPATMMVV